MKLFGAVAIAFASGLVFASGLDLTRFGYAQQSGSRARTPVSQAAYTPPANVESLNASFVGISEQVTPAVVSIEAERTVQRRTQQRDNQQQRRQSPPGLEDFFQQFDPRQQEPQQASGSGFIVSPEGYILTNNHVVADFDKLKVKLTDNREYSARLIGRDSTTDVAVIKIDGATNLPVTVLGEDDAVRVGEWVLAIGNPLGLDHTVTAGIVSAKGRGSTDLDLYRGNQYAISDFIQTDAAINPGNSGGPLVNIRGEVIAINSAIATRTGYYQGYGFAIPISLARDVMNDLIKYGRIRRAVIGVSIRDVTAAEAAAAKLPQIAGVQVGGYSSEDSPARKAGLQEGDIILKADGKVADRVGTLQRIIRSHEPGETVEIEAYRYGQRKTFKVKLAEAPSDAAQVAATEREAPAEAPATVGTNASKLGITVEPVSADFARQAKVPEERRGLRVMDVDPQGTAQRQFVPGGIDIIVEVIYPAPRKAIRTANDLQSVLSKVPSGEFVSLLIYNAQQQSTRVVSLKVSGE
ncbi:MAG: trypsin-like peptidase domain-containing protein [Gemmatimonadetes bacterium]|nr:trypsin-like peptidase domain-containing protein [Gemmatimonadota bacterium]